VLLAVSQDVGIHSDCIPQIASGFGGGIGKQGQVCGAVSGGVMAIGLVHGRKTADDVGAKELTYKKTGEFIQAFREINQQLNCRDLLGIDVWHEEGMNAYRARNLKSGVCFGVVGNAVRLVSGLLMENDVERDVSD